MKFPIEMKWNESHEYLLNIIKDVIILVNESKNCF